MAQTYLFFNYFPELTGLWVRGWTQLTILGNNKTYTVHKFLVVDTPQHSLLSWSTCQEMNFLQLGKTDTRNISS